MQVIESPAKFGEVDSFDVGGIKPVRQYNRCRSIAAAAPAILCHHGAIEHLAGFADS